MFLLFLVQTNGLWSQQDFSRVKSLHLAFFCLFYLEVNLLLASQETPAGYFYLPKGWDDFFSPHGISGREESSEILLLIEVTGGEGVNLLS